MKSTKHVLGLPAGLLLLVALACCALRANAQEGEDNILMRLILQNQHAGAVSLRQPMPLIDAMDDLKAYNAKNPGLEGYRVRVYRGLGKNARDESQAIMNRIFENHPGLTAYRTFESPYYKVTVGDCRTRAEAFALRLSILREFPKAFVIAEHINFPASMPYSPETENPSN